MGSLFNLDTTIFMRMNAAMIRLHAGIPLLREINANIKRMLHGFSEQANFRKGVLDYNKQQGGNVLETLRKFFQEINQAAPRYTRGAKKGKLRPAGPDEATQQLETYIANATGSFRENLDKFDDSIAIIGDVMERIKNNVKGKYAGKIENLMYPLALYKQEIEGDPNKPAPGEENKKHYSYWGLMKEKYQEKKTGWGNSEEYKMGFKQQQLTQAKEGMDELGKSMHDMSMKGMMTNFAMSAVMKMMDALSTIFKLFEPLISVVAGMLSLMMAETIKPLMPFIMQIVQWLMLAMPFIQEFAPILTTIIGVVLGLLGVLNPVTAVIMAVIGAIAIFVKYWEPIKRFFIWVGAMFLEFFKLIWNGLKALAWPFIQLINGVIDGINMIFKTNYKLIDFKWTEMKMPEFATGGYIPASTGGTVARIGEGGSGEYIFPEGKFNNMERSLAKIARNTTREKGGFGRW